MLKAYKYRIYPSDSQKETLKKWFGACRFIYNLGLETKIAAWTSARKNVTCFDLIKQLTHLKRNEAPWLSECSRQSLESALTNLDNAYTKFFKGGGFPKFKKRSSRQSITFRQDSAIRGDKIKFTKLGLVDIVLHRPLPENCQIRTCVVSKTPSDDYYVSVLVETGTELPNPKPITIETSVGIDVGLKQFATLSDGQVFENPKYLHEQLKRLRIEQRTLQRRYKKGVKMEDQSKGYHRQKLVVAKLHEKIANKRKDFLHKTSSAIIKKYDTICLEDLNVKGMMQNSKLSKAIADVSWSQFMRILEYKAKWYGKNISYLGRFEASSKICSTCGNHFKDLKLSDRIWTCEKCGTNHDRDQNAALNIKLFGLRNKALGAKTAH